ncbi:hypothetical protein SPI_02308 [Niveomyces insectorum RCEF 264]|uniref:Uncharacterized protein n=1 Tax=Niveomyces insectorum RCEF 264 TaxID=1081102 RepID=A0A167XX34_9HYPO|nr:hypothetical protein SPI_02308 [Niveomyces insectorum RCEF 264]
MAPAAGIPGTWTTMMSFASSSPSLALQSTTAFPSESLAAIRTPATSAVASTMTNTMISMGTRSVDYRVQFFCDVVLDFVCYLSIFVAAVFITFAVVFVTIGLCLGGAVVFELLGRVRHQQPQPQPQQQQQQEEQHGPSVQPPPGPSSHPYEQVMTKDPDDPFSRETISPRRDGEALHEANSAMMNELVDAQWSSDATASTDPPTYEDTERSITAGRPLCQD